MSTILWGSVRELENVLKISKIQLYCVLVLLFIKTGPIFGGGDSLYPPCLLMYIETPQILQPLLVVHHHGKFRKGNDEVIRKKFYLCSSSKV